jgi:predicted dehydrogenase
VIGTGRMGLTHCQAFANPRLWGQLPVELVAISDVCAPRLEKAHQAVAQLQPGVEVGAHRDFRELFDLGLHGVVIATPVHWHVPIAIEALAAGLDVYVEKPSSNRLDEALQLGRAVEASGGVVQVGAQMIREPKYAAARELIAAGRIGTPTCAQTSYCRNSLEGEWLYPIDEAVRPGAALDWEAWCGPLAPEPWSAELYHRWPRYRRFSTGILGDMLVHVLTPMVWALDAGWPLRVAATGAHLVDRAMENHDQLTLSVQFEGGTTLLAMGSTCSELGLETLVRGHEATLYLGGNHCVLTPERINLDAEPEEQRFEGIHAQFEHRRDWIRCIRSREEPLGDVETAAKVAAIIDMGARALWDGGSWELDADTLQLRRS